MTIHLDANQRIPTLKDRAEMFAQARDFFKKRNICEVDCPILTGFASVDAHIDLIPALYLASETRYLHSSPEYGMKRLLAEGIGDIYQLSHVFRDGEHGLKHNPEFTMIEWYRIGFPFPRMIEETAEFIRLFLKDIPLRVLTYREAFKEYTGLDYLVATPSDLVAYLEKQGKKPYPEIIEEGKDALLNFILGTMIEPYLGKEELTALTLYPASQSTLSRTYLNGDEPVAERFEIYYLGIELANGYHELNDANEQRSRLLEANAKRVKLKKQPLPIDERFLQAIEKGIPDCCGVAVGFDRLMMLRRGASRIADVIPFDWTLA